MTLTSVFGYHAASSVTNRSLSISCNKNICSFSLLKNEIQQICFGILDTEPKFYTKYKKTLCEFEKSDGLNLILIYCNDIIC